MGSSPSSAVSRTVRALSATFGSVRARLASPAGTGGPRWDGRGAQQQSLEDGLDHVVAAVGYGDGDPECLADLLVLAQQHVQDDPVDAVVGAVQRDRPDDVSALAEPVDPSFALLVAGRVPRQ